LLRLILPKNLSNGREFSTVLIPDSNGFLPLLARFWAMAPGVLGLNDSEAIDPMRDVLSIVDVADDIGCDVGPAGLEAGPDLSPRIRDRRSKSA